MAGPGRVGDRRWAAQQRPSESAVEGHRQGKVRRVTQQKAARRGGSEVAQPRPKGDSAQLLAEDGNDAAGLSRDRSVRGGGSSKIAG